MYEYLTIEMIKRNDQYVLVENDDKDKDKAK